jgi:hypothetical protein
MACHQAQSDQHVYRGLVVGRCPSPLERADILYRDMYSLRWTFVSLPRASGEAAFNVSRLIVHARSTI